MITKARIRRNFQFTIPLEAREAYPLEEGQYVNVVATPRGILITQAREIDAIQTWFWSPRWAEMERSADKDFRAGRMKEFPSADAAIAALKKKPGKPKRK